MGVRIEPRTVRLYEFEVELIDKLAVQKGKTGEELLLEFIRAALSRERFDNQSYDKIKEKAAVAFLEAEAKKAYGTPPEPLKKKKMRGHRGTDEIPQTNGQTSENSPQPPKAELDLEAKFLELAQKFDLSELTIEQIEPSESYLMKGRKQIRIITILKINDDNSVEYQLHNGSEQKLHTGQLKILTNNLRGAIPPSMLEEVSVALMDS